MRFRDSRYFKVPSKTINVPMVCIYVWIFYRRCIHRNIQHFPLNFSIPGRRRLTYFHMNLDHNRTNSMKCVFFVHICRNLSSVRVRRVKFYISLLTWWTCANHILGHSFAEYLSFKFHILLSTYVCAVYQFLHVKYKHKIA